MADAFNSILTSTKKVLQIPEEYEVYDLDIVTHINSVFATLHQLGVGPKRPYFITDKTNLWTEFIQNNYEIVSVRSYMWAKVRLMFDPPQNAFLVSSLEKTCSEYEFRLNVAAEEVQNGINP